MNACTCAWCAARAEPGRGLRRRRLLQGAGLLAGGAWWPARAAARPDEAQAFAARSLDEVLLALGGVPEPSERIVLELPELAEDGAFVPLRVSSLLPGTREILVVVEGNPQPLAARFSIHDGTEPSVATRIRMAQSGTVLAAVRTDAGLYAAARTTRVLVGACR